MGLKTGLDGRKIKPHRDSFPDRPARSSVAIPTELPGPHLCCVPHRKYFWGDQIKKMGNERCTWHVRGRGAVHTELSWGELMERGSLEDLGPDGSIILKWIFK